MEHGFSGTVRMSLQQACERLYNPFRTCWAVQDVDRYATAFQLPRLNLGSGFKV